MELQGVFKGRKNLEAYNHDVLGQKVTGENESHKDKLVLSSHQRYPNKGLDGVSGATVEGPGTTRFKQTISTSAVAVSALQKCS